MDTFETLDDSKLTNKDREDVLDALMWPTEKRDGIIRGRTCADGRKKLSYIKIEYYASLMVSLEAIMITSAIESH